MEFEARVLHALLRQNFNAFVEKAFATLAPGQTFVPGWPLQAIGWQLERVRRGEIKRLIINLPPRSLKSIMSSVAFPAFLLGHDPTQRIIFVSYSGDLARKHANDFRALMEAAWYRDLFPSARIGNKDSETEIELVARGFRLATSVGGTLTGRGAQHPMSCRPGANRCGFSRLCGSSSAAMLFPRNTNRRRLRQAAR